MRGSLEERIRVLEDKISKLEENAQGKTTTVTLKPAVTLDIDTIIKRITETLEKEMKQQII
ncbi:hypothetical protein [Anaerophilus nitritogenes]|uniref:hypothetical protein n=1 Tax=Anaerophilus nitritogenes TaxID=2498136 RepID=UPI00101C9E45|nr:hypothetical protein [Anaerophilus nitritogenes]